MAFLIFSDGDFVFLSMEEFQRKSLHNILISFNLFLAFINSINKSWDNVFHYMQHCKILPFKMPPTEICRNRAASPTRTCAFLTEPGYSYTAWQGVHSIQPEPLRTAKYLHGTTVFSSNRVSRL